MTIIMQSPRSRTGLLLLALCSSSSSFVIDYTARQVSLSLSISKKVADMVDDEYYRRNHKREYEKKWMEKNRNHILHHVPTHVDGQDNEMLNFRQAAKDKKMARQDPEKYCADRCVATGNCDVYEDIFELSPEEVLAFCNDCVLSEEKDECDIPSAFYEYGAEDLEDSGFTP